MQKHYVYNGYLVRFQVYSVSGFPSSSLVRNLPTFARCRFDSWVRKIPWSRKRQQELQCSCQKNSMDKGAWWAIQSRGCRESDTAEHACTYSANKADVDREILIVIDGHELTKIEVKYWGRILRIPQINGNLKVRQETWARTNIYADGQIARVGLLGILQSQR